MTEPAFHFELGRSPEGQLRCSLPYLVDTRLLIQANSGGGKSWCLRRLLEQTHGHVQHLILDPDGEFASLREHFDYVLVGRRGADAVADARSAKVLAERLLGLGVSAIFDIYELKMDERIRFARVFLEALVEAPKHLWHPALVVVDEAHLFCPQKGEAESAAAVIDLATRGRKRGFCTVLATQRLSKLNKDAAAECNNKLIGRTALDLDVARAADELGLSRPDREQLRGLEPGEFFAFGPALCAKIRRVNVGPVRTTHPKAGARLAFAPPPPTETIRALLPQLADLPAAPPLPADSEARVAALEQELAKARARATDFCRRYQEVASTLRDLERQLRDAAALVSRLEQEDEVETRAEGPTPNIDPASRGRESIARTKPSLAENAKRAEAETAGSGRGRSRLPRPQQAILNALAWLEHAREAALRVQVALMAGASPKSSAFANNLGSLRTQGLLDYPAGRLVKLTDAGRRHARPEGIPTTSAALQAALFARLPAPCVRILQALVEVYPGALEKGELADRASASAKSSAFANNLGALRTLGLLDYPRSSHVRATPALFLPEKVSP